MTHRGRYSYASSAVSSINSPRRMRRRKDPTPFNVLIIGARSSGKTSFLNFLKTSLALTGKKNPIAHDTWHQEVRSGNFVSSFIETEIDNERIGLTVWDSEGLERNVVDLQLREMTSFVESKFEETFTEETKVVRAPGARDTHIHCAFLLLDPVRLDNNLAHSSKPGFAVNGASNAKSTGTPSGPLDEDLDLQVLRALKGKTTVIPVIAKADTITTAHMKYLKKSVWETIKKANLDPLEPLGLDDEEEQSNPDRLEEEEEEEEEEEKEKEKDKDTEEEIPAATAKEPTTPVSASPQSNRSSKRISISSSLRRLKAENNSNGNLAIQQEIPLLPLSIISPDTYEPDLRGRQFPWGFADPMNEAHCDFPRLKEAVFCEWRAELREVSRELWYEGWRTTRLNGVGGRALRR